MSDEWPVHSSGFSYGGMYSASGAASTSSRASASASFQLAPCTCTSAPCALIFSTISGFVVVGTITRTAIPSCRPTVATAWPALPPDELIRLVAPRACSVLHMYAIPRSLNEPDGCSASILRSTRVPTSSESGIDSTSGVFTTRPAGIFTVVAAEAVATPARRGSIVRMLNSVGSSMASRTEFSATPNADFAGRRRRLRSSCCEMVQA